MIESSKLNAPMACVLGTREMRIGTPTKRRAAQLCTDEWLTADDVLSAFG